MPLLSSLTELGLLPESGGTTSERAGIASSIVRYLRACEMVGHGADPKDADGALRQLRWAAEDPRLEAWAWQDPSLKALHAGIRRTAFARAIAPAPGFVSTAVLEIASLRGSDLSCVLVVLHGTAMPAETREPPFEVELATDATGADRDSWSAWRRLRWRPPVENEAATYGGSVPIAEGSAVLARFRSPGRPWQYVGKESWVADGRTPDRWVEPTGL